MKPQRDDKPTKDGPALPPIKDWASAPKLPADHWIYKGGPQMTFVGGLGPSTESPEKPSEAGTPAPKERKYTPQQLREKLLALGVKDATLKPGSPTAFELPGYPNSQPKQG